MDALAQKKIAEAKQHIADAEKSMKTSLFKRKPDLESASNSYAQAGSCFRVAKEFKQAIECCRKSAECYAQNNGLFNAAKQYEQMGLMANELKDYKLLFESFQKAAENMITSGTRDSAGILLERGATMLKQTDPAKSLLLYKRALQIAEVEDKVHEMVSFYENMVLLALRSNQYDEAVAIIKDSFKVLDRVGSSEQYNRNILTVMIIYLSRDDWVGAKSFLESMRDKYNMQSDGPTRMDDMLQAYEEKDDAKFKDLLKSYLNHMVDNEALKIAQKIVKSDEWLKAQEENKAKPAPAPSSSSNNFPLPPVQKASFEPAAVPLHHESSDLKITDLDMLEPDGCGDHPEEDNHEKDKHDREQNEGEFVDDDAIQKGHELDIEPDGAELAEEDHRHEIERLEAHNKEAHRPANDDDDEFGDGIL